MEPWDGQAWRSPIALASPDYKFLPSAARLCWRHFVGRTKALAADTSAVAVLQNPKAVAVPHDQIKVVSVRDFLVHAAADGRCNFVWFEGHEGTFITHKLHTFVGPTCPTHARDCQIKLLCGMSNFPP